MKKIILAVGALIIAALGVYVFLVPVPKTAEVGRADYKNGTYTVEGTVVALKNGSSSVPSAPGSASVVTTKYFGNEVKGDFNSDGIPDIAFLITQNSGGSGTFYYVVAALQNKDGGYTGTNGVWLGDRIAPQTTEYKDGVITVNFAVQKPGDPMTAAPSMGTSRYFKVENEVLVEVPRPVVTSTAETGVLSGIVLLGPTCPVMRNPPDPQCADKPFSTSFFVYEKDDTTPVKKFTSGSDGTFRVDLPPGVYGIGRGEEPGFPNCASSGAITVLSGKTATTTLYCDSGIR